MCETHPRRFSQSCEVSDHRRQNAAAVPLEPSATGYLLKSERFHVRHEETHRSTRLLLMSESLNSCFFSFSAEALEAFSLTIDDHYETEQLLTIFGQKRLIPPSLTLNPFRWESPPCT